MLIKKLATGIGLFAVGSYLLMGTGMGSYVRTAVAQTVGYCRGQVPLEFEIERARTLVTELTPDIHDAMKSIAEEEVKLARLRTQVDSAEKNLKSEQVAILALRDQISKGLVSYKIGSETYSADAINAELNRRFNSYKRTDDTLKSKRAMVDSREQMLRAARQKYDGLLEGKQALEGELASLEAKHKLVVANKTADRFSIDDSALSRVRQLMEQIDDRIAVEAKVSEEGGQLLKRIPAEEIPPVDLGKQIDQYFHKTDTAVRGTSI